jgi:hypothetical protein
MNRVAAAIGVVVALIATTGCGDPPTAPSQAGVGPGALRIDSVVPEIGSTITPTTVAIRGAGFERGATVSVGDMVLQPSSPVADGLLIVSVPARPPSVFAVVVTNPGGAFVRRENGFRFEADLPTDPVPVRITGQLLAGSDDVPFAGATVRLVQDPVMRDTLVTTDDDGQFTLTGSVGRNVDPLNVQVRWPGFDPWMFDVARSKSDQIVLRVTDVLAVRAGMTIRGELTVADDAIHGSCTDDSVRCLPLIVAGPASASIDLELVSEPASIGLYLTEPFRAPDTFPKRLTVKPTKMWIMGVPGTFTLTATPSGGPGPSRGR